MNQILVVVYGESTMVITEKENKSNECEDNLIKTSEKIWLINCCLNIGRH